MPPMPDDPLLPEPARPSAWTQATAPDDPPRCPYCGEMSADLRERHGATYLCCCCCRSFPVTQAADGVD